MLRVGFLGGVAEFGGNCCFVEFNNEIIIIDVGFKFFTDNEMGIRYQIPDFAYLIKNKKKIKGVLITHGHLDHIGGLPYFIDHIQCDIYCSPFSHYLIKKQLRDKRGIKNLKIINEKSSFNLGVFKIEAFSVNHSIYESLGFVVHTPLKDETKLIFCGDIKYDDEPFAGGANDFSLIDKYKKNPKVLFLDSTNATERGYNLSESKVYVQIGKIYKEFSQKNRIVFTTFSSQIQRLLEIIDASIKHGREVVAIGRSISENLKYILNLKEYQKYSKHIFYSEERLKEKKKFTVLATGSQGEENSAISKILTNKIRHFQVNQDDLFVFTSSIIPGNENKIYSVWNDIYFSQAEVVSYKEREIHASGHGKVDELKKVIKRVAPNYLVPIHGEYRNLYNQKKLAIEMKFRPERIHVPHKGDILMIFDGEPRGKSKKIELDYNLGLHNIILDREDHVINQKTIDERKKMAENGILLVKLSKKNSNEIKIKAMGISNFHGNEIEALKDRILNQIGESPKHTLENIAKSFFRENNISCPLVVRI